MNDRRQATERQRAACRSMGTSQCAPICLSNLAPYGPHGCPEAGRLWTDEAIAQEARRRPDGPLSAFAEGRTEDRAGVEDPLG